MIGLYENLRPVNCRRDPYSSLYRDGRRPPILRNDPRRFYYARRKFHFDAVYYYRISSRRKNINNVCTRILRKKIKTWVIVNSGERYTGTVFSVRNSTLTRNNSVDSNVDFCYIHTRTILNVIITYIVWVTGLLRRFVLFSSSEEKTHAHPWKRFRETYKTIRKRRVFRTNLPTNRYRHTNENHRAFGRLPSGAWFAAPSAACLVAYPRTNGRDVSLSRCSIGNVQRRREHGDGRIFKEIKPTNIPRRLSLLITP